MNQNYKIFTNGVQLRFATTALPEWMDHENIMLVQLSDPNEFSQLIPLIEDPLTLDSLIIVHKDPQRLLSELKKKFKHLEAAGGLVKNGDSYLMIKKYGKWDLPKGKIDSGERPEAAAMREVHEETRVKAEVDRKLQSTWHTYLYEDQWYLKETHWYLMQASITSEPVPQKEEDIKEAKWIGIDAIGKYLKNTYPALIDLFEEVGIKS